ncbi:hypothetical protein HII31_01280 [Pseudocercospora fuligena]|uniref:DUF4185 domain-containing protein n=1 Tax=Pseudocercospora fuligena TaxID=685502 RepID=A0A8H6VMP8_9PEZI|nr:hypothetical protein HII31_01280 [Pseudocercospora fuligena]
MTASAMLCLLAALSLTAASPVKPRAATPVLKTASEVGYISSFPTLNRDSMVATRIGNRMLWTSRDAMNYDNQDFFFISSSASWTNLTDDGSPQLVNGNLSTYGGNYDTASGKVPFFPPSPAQTQDEANHHGTRWLNWPDSPPLPVNSSEDGSHKLYTFTRAVHWNTKSEADNFGPATSLFRLDYTPSSDPNALPTVSVVNYTFWPEDSVPFGNYGWVLGQSDGLAYLYGYGSNCTMLARVEPSRIEDKTAYEFFNPQATSGLPFSNKTVPSFNEISRFVPNAGTGQQGTFFYSKAFACYFWIGGSLLAGPEFWYTTAPNPWGPWETPQHLWTARAGTDPKGLGYSWQAHPGMSSDGKDIWLSFSRLNHYYENVLVKVTWQ